MGHGGQSDSHGFWATDGSEGITRKRMGTCSQAHAAAEITNRLVVESYDARDRAQPT